MSTALARVGGRLSLDFVNTIDGRHDPVPTEFVPDYDALLDWVGRLDTPIPAPVEVLRVRAAADPEAAQAVYRRAHALRESMAAVFEAAIGHRQVVPEDLARVNAELCTATDHHVLRAADDGGVRDGWDAGEALDSPLWPIVVDAWDVLTGTAIRRVRECPGDACGWLFLDTSRSGTRRWCDMKTCGNRAKVRSHYVRTTTC